MSDHSSTALNINKNDTPAPYFNESRSPTHQSLAMNILTSPTKPPPAPKKRNKFHAMFLRAMDKRAAKQRGTPEQQKAASLKFAASALHADIERATWAANELLKRAKATPRPATPPERDALFEPPRVAPLSSYEVTVESYNDVVEGYEKQQAKCRWLQQRVEIYLGVVREFQDEFVPARKMGGMEHEVEGLENAGVNLGLEVAGLRGVLGEVRERAVA
ncbi:hypothetical protein LTR08_005076 [Meristemomyces frigidus]|nr:hypothetical protein LTR08_005076 [Meristemomyces frigidus]